MVEPVLTQVIRDVDMVVTSLDLERKIGGEVVMMNIFDILSTYIHIVYSQPHSHSNRDLDNVSMVSCS